MDQHSIRTRTIETNILEQGRGPLILFCHGFPETSYAWRHQIGALAGAGFRAVAPDMRGYGGTEAPEAVEDYTLFHIVGDLVALLDALEERTALLVGNDWGATVAWQAAQMRPDRFAAVVAIGVPMMERPPIAPTQIFPWSEEALHYTLHVQQPGLAEAELEQDPRRTLRKLLFGASGDNEGASPVPFGMVSRSDGWLAPLADPDEMPSWLSEADLDTYVEAFTRSGFRGGLNYYRNLDRNWQLQSALAGSKVEVPALFLAGERDAGLNIPGMREIIAAMPVLVPKLYRTIMVPDAGHWVPQERPDAVTEAILEFASALPVGSDGCFQRASD